MPEQQRIMHIIYSLKAGGAEELLSQWVRHRESAHEHHIVCAWRDGGPLESVIRGSGATLHVLRLRRRRSWTGPLALWDLVTAVERLSAIGRDSEATLIHGHLNDGALLAVLVARRLGRPALAHVHSHHLVPLTLGAGTLAARAWTATLGWSLRRAALVACVSEEVRRTVRARFKMTTACLCVVPVGVRPPAVSGRRSAARDRLGLAPDVFVAGFVGRLVANKNQIALLEMMAHVRTRHENVRLLLAGEGPDRDRLADRARALGFDPDDILLDRVGDVAEFLAAADVFVTASLTEGTSLAVVEAMAAGLPIVALDAEGNRDTLAEGAGWLVPDARPETLGDAVLRLAHEPTTRRRLRDQARARYEACYSWEAMMNALTEAYGAAAGAEPR